MDNINNSKLRIIPLGGLEAIGMNITAFEFEDSIVVVDCGLSFPTEDMLGIDLVIPDVTYLKENIEIYCFYELATSEERNNYEKRTLLLLRRTPSHAECKGSIRRAWNLSCQNL